MSDDLEALRRQCAALADREAIRDVLYGIARGTDRFDPDLLRACIHPDAKLDMGGDKTITGANFAAMLKPPAQLPIGRMHVVTNIQITLDGDRARSECFILSCQEIAKNEGAITRVRAGRYLDRFERRSGVWKLSARTMIDEWGRTDDVKEPSPKGAHRGKPAPDDLVYLLLAGEAS